MKKIILLSFTLYVFLGCSNNINISKPDELSVDHVAKTHRTKKEAIQLAKNTIKNFTSETKSDSFVIDENSVEIINRTTKGIEGNDLYAINLVYDNF